MVHFYKGGNTNNYVTLEKPTHQDVITVNDTSSERHRNDVMNVSRYGKVVKMTRCRGDVLMLKILTGILMATMVWVSYLTYVTHTQLKSLTTSVIVVKQTLIDKGLEPSYTCNFSIGYGSGGSKVKIGYQIGEACVHACSHMKRIDDTVNGVTVFSDRTKLGCWCEKNMKSIVGRHKTCFLTSHNVTRVSPTVQNQTTTPTCTFLPGDGVGGSEFKMGELKGDACVKTCLHLQQIDRSINGITTYTNTSKKGCWCKQDMRRLRPSRLFKTCVLNGGGTTQFEKGKNHPPTCNFTTGNGVGGTDIKVGYQEGHACVLACLHMRRIIPTINGVTMYTNPKSRGCWCERNMREITGTFKTCFLKPR